MDFIVLDVEGDAPVTCARALIAALFGVDAATLRRALARESAAGRTGA